ncbi:MAG: transposase [Bacillota bacterium]|nr:transposase [Bacillota bacterium]
MKRIPPSEQFRQEWDQILCNGVGENETLLDALSRAGARYMLQVAIEQEVTEYLGRGRYQRGDRDREGYRNGYEPKTLLTGQGPIELAAPQVRNTSEPYRSQLLDAVAKRTTAFDELIRRMYVRGLSQRDVADLFWGLLFASRNHQKKTYR